MTDTTDIAIVPVNETALRNIVDILRTGDYQQARGALRVDNPDGSSTFCCLGVMCDVLHPGEWLDGTLVDLESGNVIETNYRLVSKDEHGEVWELLDEAKDVPPYREYTIETWGTGTARRIRPSDNDDSNGLFTLPRSVQIELGITASGEIHAMWEFGDRPDDLPWHMSLGHMSLASMNDDGASFDEIADVIEYVLDNPDVAKFATVSLTPEEASLAS